MTRVTLGKSRVRESCTPGSVRAKAEWLSYSTVTEAILAAPDRTTWLGHRDHTLLLLAAQTGLRLSELIGLDRDAIQLGAGAHVRAWAKGGRNGARH